MKITSTGNYLTRDWTSARVTRIDSSGSPIGFVGKDGMVWCTDEGHVHSDRREHPLDIVSASTWRERVLKLIEGATICRSDPDAMFSGDFVFHNHGTSIDIYRADDKCIGLRSPEFIDAFNARMTKLRSDADRAYDDANAEAIERILQPTTTP